MEQEKINTNIESEEEIGNNSNSPTLSDSSLLVSPLTFIKAFVQSNTSFFGKNEKKEKEKEKYPSFTLVGSGAFLGLLFGSITPKILKPVFSGFVGTSIAIPFLVTTFLFFLQI